MAAELARATCLDRNRGERMASSMQEATGEAISGQSCGQRDKGITDTFLVTQMSWLAGLALEEAQEKGKG